MLRYARRMIALVIGRFHALTRTQADWLAALGRCDIDRIVCVLTSADKHGTRRNPMRAEVRESFLRPALARSGKPFDLVRLDDTPEPSAWVAHLRLAVRSACGLELSPDNTRLHTANLDVELLFRAEGFSVELEAARGLTPHELLQRIAQGRPWIEEASPETRGAFEKDDVLHALRSIFQETLINDDGELGQGRDFASYGAMMDASSRQKLDDLLPFVRPGFIVDKGCGTGRLLVELSRLFPDSHFVGVDLSRELLRISDQNTFWGEAVSLVLGNAMDQNVPAGRASTIIFSSVMHELYSYGGYDLSKIEGALRNALTELMPGGRVLIRDGICPPPGRWRLRFLAPETAEVFRRFARELCRGRGVEFETIGEDEVLLSARDANEFLCKKDYQTNWHIEIHEAYCTLTLEEWRQMLLQVGLVPLHLHAYVNPWIAKHRYEGVVTLCDEQGAQLPWPPTNLVAVAEKR